MKKTGIVSCYFIHNYGSMLQAYATQKVLDKLEVNNETINVSGFIGQFRKAQYTYILKSGLTSDIFKDRLGKAKNLLVKKFLKNDYTRNIRKRDIKFDEFASTVIRKSEVYGSLAELAEKCEKNYDTVLIGSDQLWLPANIAADYFEFCPGKRKFNCLCYELWCFFFAERCSSDGEAVFTSDKAHQCEGANWSKTYSRFNR